jgi:hypothetical protein
LGVDFSKHNKVFPRTFGRTCIFTPAATGIPQEIRGVLGAGASPEGLPPGESMNMVLFIARQEIDPTPAAGDEIQIGATVYKVLGLPESDIEGAGLYLPLRKDRQAE